jgi:hypothetical protein
LVAARTCLVSRYALLFPGTDEEVCNATPSRFRVNVKELALVFVTIMLVTTAVVPDGTVYSVVFDVDAAPRNITLDVTVAINYYLS